MKRSGLRTLRIGRWIVAAVFVLVAAITLDAKTVTEYREEVAHLREDFEALLEPPEIGEDEEFARFETEVFEEVREFASDRERIGFSGTEIEADNSWLTEKLNEYKAGSKTREEREAILAAIHERLGAIENKLYEIERAEGSAAPKDQNKQKLSEILSGEEYRRGPEDNEQSIFSRFMQWLEEWFRQLFPPQEAQQPRLDSPNIGALGFILQVTLYVAIALVIGFLLYKFGPKLLKRRKEAGKADRKERVVLGEKIEAGATTEELFSEAERLVNEGRVREALRKGYIALLFGLGEKKAIGLAKHKTNRDYLNELRKRTDVHDIVSGLTSQYERHWYGASEAAEEDWLEFAGGYSEALGRKGG